MRIFGSWIMAVAIVMLASASAWGEEQAPVLGEQGAVAAQSANGFALDLYRELRRAEGNLFLSPWSIHTALTMVMAGAAGETESAMRQTLQLPGEAPQEELHAGAANLAAFLAGDMSENGYEFTSANRLWAQQGLSLNTEYLDVLNASYGAGLESLDFINATEEARTIINQWVEEQTNERIINLIPLGMLTSDTRFVLTNAVYFLGVWDEEFNPEDTQPQHFYPEEGGDVMAETMYGFMKAGYAERGGVQVLELPYAGDKLSMVLLLPEQGGLESLEAGLDIITLQAHLMDIRTEDVHVWLPKWENTSEYGLTQVLRVMGMEPAFGPEADFSAMDAEGGFALSEVVHKAFVAVDEHGTEAAAATGAVMVTSAMPTPPKEFRADHPFVYLIRDRESGVILFMGRMADPTQ